jgi:TPR repeat protein
MKLRILFLALLTATSLLQTTLADTDGATTGAQETPAQSAASEFEAGRNFLHGRGLEKAPEKALEHFQKAAELGHAEAPGAIGYFYSVGLVVEKDDVKAAEWFQKGSDNGSAAAKFNLGKFHLENPGGVGGTELGLALMEEAADLGLTQAHTTLAEIYYLGTDRIAIDHDKAYRHAEAAARAGVTTAETMLGVMKEYGYGTPMNLVEAEKWFRKAAQKGEFKAQSNLGHLLDPASEDPKRRLEATAWLIIAASQNEPLAVRTLAELQENMPKEEFSKARDLADDLQKKIAEAEAK